MFVIAPRIDASATRTSRLHAGAHTARMPAATCANNDTVLDCKPATDPERKPPMAQRAMRVTRVAATLVAKRMKARLVVFVALSASLALGPGAAFAGHENDHHCMTPTGADLNAVFGTSDAFVAVFCPQVGTGDRWRPIAAWFAAGSDYVFPPGYVPSRPTPVADFLAKFVSARYVVDVGTARERSYSFAAKRLAVQSDALADGTQLVRWTTPSMHPLSPGYHSVDQYVTLSADSWDGFGLDPAVNLVPAGEVLWDSTRFEVIKPRAGR